MTDDLDANAREAGLDVSRLAQPAGAEELDRLAKVAKLDAYLAELEDRLGPTSAAERAAAKAWADEALGDAGRRHSA